MKKILAKLVKFFSSPKMGRHLVVTLISAFALSGLIIGLMKINGTEVVFMVAGGAVGFLGANLLSFLLKIIFGFIEDYSKVTSDTNALLKIYEADGKGLYEKTIELNGKEATIAYYDTFINYDKNNKFAINDDNLKEFELDDAISGHFSELLSAHSHSELAFETTLRLDDFTFDGEKYIFHTSRSTLVNNLVTNRAIDFPLSEGLTLRNIYDYGPYLVPLNRSKMSNHIGINCLVFLNDGHILLPKRNGKATISKNQITSSIAVRYRFPKYSDPFEKIEDVNSLLVNPILVGLNERLHISNDYIANNSNIENHFLGFGMNIYEGGKPQFYFTCYLKDVDLNKYYELLSSESSDSKYDQDKLVYAVKFNEIRFNKKGLLVLKCHNKKTNKYRNIVLDYEKSFLANIYHHQKVLENK